MKRITGRNSKGKKNRVKGQVNQLTREEYKALALDSRVELIRSLIPLGLMFVAEELQREVEVLAGERYARKTESDGIYRYGSNPGTIKMLGQRVPVRVPRLRDTNGEVPLESYEQMHRGLPTDEMLFRRVLYGISCKDYEGAAECIPGAIGVSKSTVSRRFIETSAKELKSFQERDLSEHDVVAVFLDGKTFADDLMVIALGVTMEGDKVFLGFVQTDTENKAALSQFLRSLLDRGLDISRGLLAIIDGGKGLHAAVKSTFKKRVVVQRCQWHKRENVVSYLPKSEQAFMRKRLQKAYERPTYKEAHDKLKEIRKELEERNQSAVESLDEGFEETLTLHRLGVFAILGKSFKTTNCLESINSLAEQRCHKVDHWKNSNQKQRWLAAALNDIEPRLHKVRGYRHLDKLRAAIMKELKIEMNTAKAA
ncbi:MAG: IS256 family transposase [Candidatus Altiarchaeota archaeon]|nr:IS256 family transposase [Candidatus Altiarchaeota archaeon]